MIGYTPTEQTNYAKPYKLMLHDYQEEIESYKNSRKMAPNYIIINPDDAEPLRHEMATLHLLPLGHTGKLQYQGIKIIQSSDIMKGFFEVVGN